MFVKSLKFFKHYLSYVTEMIQSNARGARDLMIDKLTYIDL